MKAIPSSGEKIPVIGMGTSRTFDMKGNPESLATLTDVMRAFADGGGTVIDSSPMYGRAEERVGDVLRSMSPRPEVFAATKVWTRGKKRGIKQMLESEERMGVQPFDLIAVHNLKDWKTHLATLAQWQEEGRVRYVGITTSHGRYHDDFEELMATQKLDFVQFSYNIEDRTAEERLLPLAAEHGIATMINRPFQRGDLFDRARGKPLPPLAAELGCSSWAQFFLKYIAGHPAVTCIIPATAKAKHMRDNMLANRGVLPDAAQRNAMQALFETL
ncbi:MAG: aldo/keto reductase [Halioglobus sp.]|nr:aldo/keto reductase [Halioglobus sp.]